MASTDWQPPRVRVGDIVLFSRDLRGFTDPTAAVVTGVGDTTISVSVFTPNGIVWQHSVHHKDDPAIHGDHGWDELGAWDLSDMTKAIYALAATKNTAEAQKSGR